MNSDFDKKAVNHYDGNGWSKYQLMVLQQLDDHNKILQNFNKEINDLKQTMAVSDMETKMWKTQFAKTLEKLDTEIDSVLHADKDITNRIINIENALNIEEGTENKLKATWALYAAVLMFLINIAFQLFELFGKQ